MRIASLALCLMCCFCFVSCGSSSSGTAGSANDSISVISISPSSVVSGQTTTLNIDVSYTLATKDNGVLSIAISTCQANIYNVNSYDDFAVLKGSGTHTFTVSMTPVICDYSGSFKVILYDSPHTAQSTVLAEDTKSISIVP